MKNKHRCALQILIALLFAAALFSDVDAQGFIAGSVNNRGVGLQAGALIVKMIEVQAGYNTRVSNQSDKPIQFYSNIGLRLIVADNDETMWLLTPAIGIANTKYEDFSKEHIPPQYRIIPVNETKVNYAIELAAERNDIRMFASVSYSLKLYASVGMKVFIVLRKK